MFLKENFQSGSSKVQTTDVRVIAATNKDFWQLVRKFFREDLCYRLDTVQISLPPLQDNQQDIVEIFRKFVHEFSTKYDSVFKGFLMMPRIQFLGGTRKYTGIKKCSGTTSSTRKSQFIDVERLQNI